MGRSGGEGVDILGRRDHAREPPMSQSFDASRSLTAFEQDSTLVAVIEMSQSKWLVAAVVPGIARQPLKKLDADAGALLKLLQRWREEARKAGREVKRIVCAYEAGRDGFWLARWLQAQAIETYVIHAASMGLGGRTTVHSLKSSMDHVFVLARENGVQTIAIPAVGTGIAGFPMDDCARVMAHALRDALLTGWAPEEVRFVLFGEAARQTFEGPFRAAFDAV